MYHVNFCCGAGAGSSPRMWGTFKGTSSNLGLAPVHPHACGVHQNHAIRLITALGSSPRMWGTCKPFNSAIKAFAVHPHACGVHIIEGKILLATIGSSPRMWGTLTAVICQNQG